VKKKSKGWGRYKKVQGDVQGRNEIQEVWRPTVRKFSLTVLKEKKKGEPENKVKKRKRVS